MEPYIYKSLNKGETRLFHMARSKVPDSPIEGRLCNISVRSSAPRIAYTALSYAWGPTYEDGSHLTDYIVCEGRRLKVTHNLKQALLRIRALPSRIRRVRKLDQYDDSPERPSVLLKLWIDALCINQEDLDERSKQVRMMADIYESSSHLLIWLGELATGPLGNAQYDLLDQVHRKSNTMKTWISSTLLNKFLARPKPIKAESIQPQPVEVVESILNRPWFRRRWVLQETHHALAYGTFVIMGAAICFRSHLRDVLSQHELLASAPPLISMGASRDIFALLYSYDVCECSDPRDRLFALISLTHDQEQELINVDYNQDARDTYLSLVKTVALGITPEMEFEQSYTKALNSVSSAGQSWIIEDRLLYVLALASCKKVLAPEASIERWIPDWRVTNKFESNSHKEAVDSCISPFPRLRRLIPRAVSSWLEEAPIAWKLDIANNGYHYLRLAGILLKPPRAEGLRTPDAVRLGGRVWNDYALAKILQVSEGHWPQTPQTSDRIWLAKTVPEGFGSDLSFYVLAFVLQARPESAPYCNTPVYAVHSCFEICCTERIIMTEDYDRHAAHAPSTIKQRLAAYGVLIDEEFYLE